METADLFIQLQEEQQEEQQEELREELREEQQEEQRPLAEYHCQAALAAAREMRATRQKVRNCREICDHLRRMLHASEQRRKRVS